MYGETLTLARLSDRGLDPLSPWWVRKVVYPQYTQIITSQHFPRSDSTAECEGHGENRKMP